MNTVEELEARLRDCRFTCAQCARPLLDIANDAVAEARRLRDLLDKPVHRLGDADGAYCPADDEALTGDPADNDFAWAGGLPPDPSHHHSDTKTTHKPPPTAQADIEPACVQHA